MINNKIIALCGDAKFKEDFAIVAEELVSQGYSVIFTSIYDESLSPTERKAADQSKIRLADEVYVINKDNHVDEYTRDNVIYANECNKKLIFMEQE